MLNIINELLKLYQPVKQTTSVNRLLLTFKEYLEASKCKDSEELARIIFLSLDTALTDDSEHGNSPDCGVFNDDSKEEAFITFILLILMIKAKCGDYDLGCCNY
jgi:hypothetical protein